MNVTEKPKRKGKYTGRQDDLILWDDNGRPFHFDKSSLFYLFQHIDTIKWWSKHLKQQPDIGVVIKWRKNRILVINGIVLPQRILNSFFRNMDNLRKYVGDFKPQNETSDATLMAYLNPEKQRKYYHRTVCHD